MTTRESSRRLVAGGEAELSRAGRYAQLYSITPTLHGQRVYSQQGRVVGRIAPDGWLEKHVNPAVHMLRRPPGWATDEAHLALPIRGIRLHCPDGTVYEAGVELLRGHGVAINRGFGPQVVLPLAFWSVTRPNEALQLELFSEVEP